jgi:hypothetical protein
MDDDRDFLHELEQAVRAERARDELFALLTLFWEASEEVTVGLAA